MAPPPSLSMKIFTMTSYISRRLPSITILCIPSSFIFHFLCVVPIWMIFFSPVRLLLLLFFCCCYCCCFFVVAIVVVFFFTIMLLVPLKQIFLRLKRFTTILQASFFYIKILEFFMRILPNVFVSSCKHAILYT